MKKYIIGFIVVVVLAVAVQFGSNFIGTYTAIDSVRSDAAQQHMPTGFFGVSWLTPVNELRSIRPNVVPDSNNQLAEEVTFLGRKAKIDYYVKTGNVLVFTIHFLGASEKSMFDATNEALNRDYGSLSTPEVETDQFGNKYCSQRRAERFEIDHCVRLQDHIPLESIVFYRRKPQN